MKRLLRLLLIEDSEHDARLVLETLERGGFFPSPVRVGTELELRSALGERGFDLVLSDFGLPPFDALAALSVVEELAPDLPVIIVSEAVGEERAVAAMRAGARDFVLKDRPGRLLPAVERELAEAEQRQARGRAEKALREREEQLRQVQKMEAVGQLAGGVAHDLNNLLTVIAGHTELLMSDLPWDSPSRASVREIAECQERAASLIQQLLVFSRREVHKPKILDLNREVVNTGRMLRRMIGEDVEIRTVLDPQISPVYMDPGRVDQVLVSLALNARDAMPNGGRLTIETARAPEGDVLLEVADTGVGMDEVTAARVFEPFFTTKALGQGMGLGLSTVYGIIGQSEGTISLESEPGVGTRFRIRLPPADRLVELAAPEGSPAELPRGVESILVVEDETSMRRLVKRALQRAGYRVATARDGEEALELLEGCEFPIDLVLTDVVMPRMNGRELAARARVARPGLEVLFMSGYAGHPISDSLFLDQTTSLLQKPFTLDQLCRTVRQRLDTRT